MVLLSRKNDELYDPLFYKFIRPFFFAKRKKLLNNLPVNIKKEKIISILNDLGYDTDVRAEQLTYIDWQNIYKYFKK